MSNILQTIGQGIQKLGDADVQNRLQAFGATMRNDIQGAAALNSEYAARSQRNKELEAARKERLEQERTRKLERGEDRKWSVADMLAAQEFQSTQAQAGRDFQASQQEDQQEHATNLYGIQRQHQVDDRGYLSPLQKAELAGKAQQHIQEIDSENVTREALGQKPLQYNTELLKLSGLDSMVQAISQVESGGRHTNTDGSLVTSPAGAQGLMQLMPATAKNPGYGIAPAKDGSIEENMRVGKEYYAAMLKNFGGDQSKALAAYNAGPGTVQEATMKYGDKWMDAMPAETQAYIQKVMGQLEQNPAPQTQPVQPSPSQLPPTGKPRNIRDLTPQQAAILSSRGLIADIDGNLVEKKGYSGEALDTYGRPIYLNEGKVLKPSEIKAIKDMEASAKWSKYPNGLFMDDNGQYMIKSESDGKVSVSRATPDQLKDSGIPEDTYKYNTAKHDELLKTVNSREDGRQTGAIMFDGQSSLNPLVDYLFPGATQAIRDTEKTEADGKLDTIQSLEKQITAEDENIAVEAARASGQTGIDQLAEREKIVAGIPQFDFSGDDVKYKKQIERRKAWREDKLRIIEEKRKTVPGYKKPTSDSGSFKRTPKQQEIMDQYINN